MQHVRGNCFRPTGHRSVMKLKAPSHRQEVLTNARNRTIIVLAGLAVLVSGCNGAGLLPAGPTPIPAGILATQTAAAAYTQTQLAITPSATATLTPTATPTESPTPTITLTPFLSASAGQFDCHVLSQSVRNGTHFPAKQHFEMGWKVRNNGEVDWDPASVDFAYFSGTRMYQAESLRLPEGVHTGALANLSASLVSPKKDGTYMTVWALRRGVNRFCYVSVKIIVP